MSKVVLIGHSPLRNSIEKALSCAMVYEIRFYHESFKLNHYTEKLNVKRNHAYPWYKKVK